MEKIIGKSKIKSFALLKLFKKNAPLCSSQLQSKKFFGSFSTIRHYFSEAKDEKNNAKFEPIANYHNLSKTLQSLKTPNEILNLFHQNEKLFEKKTIILAVKMIAKTLDNGIDKEELKKNEVFAQLLTIIKKEIRDLEALGYKFFFFFFQNLKFSFFYY